MQGSDYAATVRVLNEDGSDADLTGYTAKAQLRRGPADCAPEVSAEMGTTVVLPNIVVLSLTNAVTSTLCGRYQWDLDLHTDLGQIVTVLAGAAIVTAEVTRDVEPAMLAGAMK